MEGLYRTGQENRTLNEKRPNQLIIINNLYYLTEEYESSRKDMLANVDYQGCGDDAVLF